MIKTFDLPFILIGTTNLHKITEYKALFKMYGPNLKYKTLLDLEDLANDAPETGKTFETNSEQKAEYYFQHYQTPVLTDDSGLEIFSLNNFPGIYSKRWLESKGFKFKLNVLLDQIGDKSSKCQYVCALTYLDADGIKTFLASVQGQLVQPTSNEGFGFDPGFYLEQEGQTFAELSLEIKNKLSHRALAFKQFIEWFKTNYSQDGF